MHSATATRADFQGCMRGWKRDKWISLVGSPPWLQKLSVKCDGSHTHDAFVESTFTDAEYPVKFCSEVARLAAQEAGAARRLVVPRDQRADPHKNELAKLRASLGTQPRAKHYTPLVLEWKAMELTAVDVLKIERGSKTAY